jgi:hypothetical protein
MTDLKIDLDTKDYKMLFEVARRAGFTSAYLERSDMNWLFGFGVQETNRGYHIYIDCSTPLNDTETVCLQAIFADDWKRSVFNLRHVHNQIPKWNVLFTSTEKKTSIGLAVMLTGVYFAYRAYYRMLRIGCSK